MVRIRLGLRASGKGRLSFGERRRTGAREQTVSDCFRASAVVYALDVRAQVRDGVEGGGGEVAEAGEAFAEGGGGDGARERLADLHLELRSALTRLLRAGSA